MEHDRKTVNGVFAAKPMTFASLLLGSQLRERFESSTSKFLEPLAIDFDSFQIVKNKAMPQFSSMKQEDASEFLNDLLGYYISENPKEKKLNSLFMSYQTSYYQCQTCYGLLHDKESPYPLYHLSLDAMDITEELSIKNLFRKELGSFNDMDNSNNPTCSKCDMKTFHKECCEMSKLPRFLFLNLKRYKKDLHQNSLYDKIICNVKCDHTVLIPEHKWQGTGKLVLYTYIHLFKQMS